MAKAPIQSDKMFEGFLKETRPYLFALVYRIAGETDDAEDIVQNVMVEAFLRHSEDETFVPSRLWIFGLAYQELVEAIGARKPWLIGDHNLVVPLVTNEAFWQKIADEDEHKRAAVSQRESLQIGFLSVLQRLGFRDRLIYVGVRVLGLRTEDLATVMKLSVDDVRNGLSRAQTLMEAHYFARDPGHTLWRSEANRNGGIEQFVKVVNQGKRGDLRKQLDSKFHCLMIPAPLFEEEIFFNDFLTQAPKCQLLNFELNGQPTFAFGDGREIHAIAVAIASAKGVSTVLGYDVDSLPPRIRTLLEPEALSQGK